MRQNLKITLLLILTSYHSFSQNALIIDNSTGKPINDVFVYHEDQNSIAYSDEKGIADLTNFPTGLVFFQHPSYVTQSVSYTGNELRVSLEEKIMSFNEVVLSAI